jgi:hypothetical protein
MISGPSKGDTSIFSTTKGNIIISASEGDIFGISEGANAFDFTTSFADVNS